MLVDKEVLDEIRAFPVEGDEADLNALDILLARTKLMNTPNLAIQPLFELLERFPDADFGSPGPIVHHMEDFFRDRYEDELLASVRRKPTFTTVWMLNRIVNEASDEDGAIFLEELRRISLAGIPDLSEQAAHHVKYHTGE